MISLSRYPRNPVATCMLGVMMAGGIGGSALAADAAGHWFGQLKSPTGVDLTLVVHLKAAVGGLEGYAESPDQVLTPIPITEIKATADTLAFVASGVKGSFSGRWDPVAKGWVGAFRQNDYDMALTLKRGAPPPRPVVAGLDGDWSGVIKAPQGDLRIQVHVKTGADGTLALFESLDQSPIQLVAFLTHQNTDVSVTLRGIGGFFGKLSADGRRMDGEWRQGDTALPLVLKRGG